MLHKTMKILTTLSTLQILLMMPSLSWANEKKTVPEECQKLFNEAEQLIKDVEKQPGSHTSQLTQIRQKLQQSKQQILALEPSLQTKSCEQGLARLLRAKGREDNQ